MKVGDLVKHRATGKIYLIVEEKVAIHFGDKLYRCQGEDIRWFWRYKLEAQ